MKILVTGSSGLVGTALCNSLRSHGHAVVRLIRSCSPSPSDASSEAIRWEPPSGPIDTAAMEGAEAVVHLAGASIGEGRWTPARKQILRSSRVDATRHLVKGLSRLKQRPRVLVSASAIGYYGDRGEEILIETSAPGNDFLAQVARDWEGAANAAERFGIRVVLLRFGVILAARGGALERMLKPVRMGVGGRLGSGRQWMSWLALDDAAGLIRCALESELWRGPVNAVAPNPVRNADFTRALARAAHRPAVFPVPRLALRAFLGEMADALLLSSQRVLPQRLAEMNYRWLHPELDNALASLVN